MKNIINTKKIGKLSLIGLVALSLVIGGESITSKVYNDVQVIQETQVRIVGIKENEK